MIFNTKTLNDFPLRLGIKAGISTLIILIQQYIGGPS